MTQDSTSDVTESAGKLLNIFGEMLDGLDIAMCVFNQQDEALYWNRNFLLYFPEHDGHVHLGEHYSANLRRFYTNRLSPVELAQIDEHIAAGIARHQSQSRPFEFEHQGRRIRVSSLTLGTIGRVRLWRSEALAAAAPAPAGRDAGPQDSPQLALMDHVPDALMISGADGVIAVVNDPFVVMYDLPSREAAIGATFEQIYCKIWALADAASDENFRAGRRTLQDNMRFCGAPFELPLPGDRYCQVIAKSMGAGQTLYAHVDISEIKRQQYRLAVAERAARESEALLKTKSVLLEATLANMMQGVLMISPQGTIDVINRRALELLGLPPELLGQALRIQDLVDQPMARGEFATALHALQTAAPQACGIERMPPHYEHRTPDGRVLEVHNAYVEEGGILCTLLDVTQRKLDDDRIRYAANHDSLTGLLNRAMFLEYLNAEVSLARRTGVGCAVLYVDLDRFKPINDLHGHATGDKVLVWVAQTILSLAREADIAARLGGDEFVLLLRGVQHREQARRLATRLEEALTQAVVIDGHPVRIGASVGIALCPHDADEPEALLKHADAAMYAAKALKA